MVDAAYMPTTCNHCDAAPCIAAAGGDAIYKRDDGIVIIDPQKVHGRKDLVKSCPYDAIWWNDELQIPQKWIFDAHLLDQGAKIPRCVQACPTGAMQAFNLDDEAMQEKVHRDELQTFRPELRTQPRVYYRNLHRFTKNFIGGSVIASRNGAIDCLADARVMLFGGNRQISETKTDCFGDFKFDCLEPLSGNYVVEVSHLEFLSSRMECNLAEKSIYLGEIYLGSKTHTANHTQQ